MTNWLLCLKIDLLLCEYFEEAMVEKPPGELKNSVRLIFRTPNY